MTDDSNDTPNKGGFKKGPDPRRNTGGRKTRDEYGRAVIDQARSMGPEMLAIMADIARNGEKDADRIKAADKVLTRAYGAAKQTIDITSISTAHNLTEVVHTSLNIDGMSPALRLELFERMMSPPAIEGEVIEQLEDGRE